MKVLHVLGDLDKGGAASFIINNMKEMDSNNIHFDFLIRKNICSYRDEIEEYGGKVYVMPEFPRHFIANYKATKDFFESHKGEYSVVHIHANALLYTLPIKLAVNKWNCKVIIHSHNTKSNVRGVSLIHKFNRKFKLPDKCIKLACGHEAGKWMYGSRRFEVINNAIDTSIYEFSKDKRNKIRNQYNISENTIVIGNIGRFDYAKNHKFLIEVFNQYNLCNKNSVLMLVGGGKINITENIKGQVRELQLDSKVIFTGEVDNTYDFYDAIDIFLMPSLFEGLPFTLIEAQTSGLPCLISENVTKEVDLTDLIHRLSLENNAEAWARELENIQLVQDRCKYHDQIVKSSYDIGFTSRRLEKIYTNQTI